MKKWITYLLLLAMVVSLWACKAETPSQTNEPTETSAAAQPGPLDGKKFLFIGNSHTYVGNVVTQVYNTYPQQEKRSNNQGFFYQVCLRQGSNVEVTNWTFSSHGLASIFGHPCGVKGDCLGLNHEEYLKDRYFDYVVIQPGVGERSEETIAEDIAYIVDFFKKENPNVQFALLGNASVYGNNSNGKTYPGITGYYKTLSEQGFIMADWGKLANDLIRGLVVPEGSTIPYAKSSFVIKDGFHPNYLSGYLASTMLYCAITGQSAQEIPGDLFTESAMAIMLDNHLAKNYDNSDYDTNCKIILTTEEEVMRLHTLIDRYLAEKHYLQ